jgi:hypothetical protein
MTPAMQAEPMLPDDQDQEQPIGSEYGVNNAELPKQLVEILRSTIVDFSSQEKFSRRREVRKDRRNRFYESGYQHLQWSNSGNGGFTQLVPGGTAYNSAGNSMQCPTYMDAYNIFFPYFRIIQSVLTQSLPGVNFQPIDPSSPEDIDKAKTAEDYAKLFDRQNDIKDLMGQIVRMFAMSGRTVSWTRTEEDAQRFGYEPDGVTPKKFQRTTVHGTLETKVPILCREFDDNFLYCIIYEDMDVKVGKDRYPEFAEEIKAGSAAVGENQYERYSRLGVLNGSRGQSQVGDSLNHIVTEAHCFLRPAAFSGAAYDVPMEDGSGTIKERLDALYPHGCRAVFVGDTYVASFAECMDDHIAIEFPYQGDGMFRPAFMDGMIVVQDNFNDLCNWIREKIDTGAGATWIDGTQEDVDAVTSQRAAPNAIRPWKGHQGMALEASFYKEPDPEIPATLFQLLEFLRGTLPEFLLAALPSLQGGAMPDNKTASGYAQANAQAKGQLAIIWARLQRMFARIRYQSALAAAEDDSSTGMVQIPGNDTDETITVNMDALKKGNFGCYPDEDSSFPESTAQKRATMQGLVALAGQSPMMLQLLDNPDNVETLKRLNGFDDLVLIPAEARNKQLAEIEKMLQEAPLPPDPMMEEQMMVEHAAQTIAARQNAGPEPPMPQAPMTPSVPVEELDYHEFEFAKCQEWLSSSARRQQDKRGNQAGVQNVILHAMEHRAKLAAAMLAAQPPPVAAGPGGPPKAEPKPAAAAPPASKPPQPGLDQTA